MISSHLFLYIQHHPTPMSYRDIEVSFGIKDRGHVPMLYPLSHSIYWNHLVPRQSWCNLWICLSASKTHFLKFLMCFCWCDRLLRCLPPAHYTNGKVWNCGTGKICSNYFEFNLQCRTCETHTCEKCQTQEPFTVKLCSGKKRSCPCL